eukprot:PhM_4_TR13307/c0_g1_i1/m.25456
MSQTNNSITTPSGRRQVSRIQQHDQSSRLAYHDRKVPHRRGPPHHVHALTPSPIPPESASMMVNSNLTFSMIDPSTDASTRRFGLNPSRQTTLDELRGHVAAVLDNNNNNNNSNNTTGGALVPKSQNNTTTHRTNDVSNVLRVRARMNLIGERRGRGVTALPQINLTEHIATLEDEARRDRTSALGRVKGMVAGWLDDYSIELDAHESVATGAQTILSQITAATKFLGKPNAAHAAVVFMLLDRLIDSMGRYGPVLRNLVNEIKRMVYIVRNVDDGEVNEGEEEDEKVDPLPSDLHSYLHTPCYFEGYNELVSQHQRDGRRAAAVERTLSKKLDVLDRACRSWQRELLRRVLLSWYNTVQRSRFRQAAIKQFTHKHNRRDLLQTAFYAWRLLCASLRADVERTQLTGNMDYILQKEAATSTRLAETEDKLEEARLQLHWLKDEANRLREENGAMKGVLQSMEYRVSQWRNTCASYVQYTLHLSETITRQNKESEEGERAAEEVIAVPRNTGGGDDQLLHTHRQTSSSSGASKLYSAVERMLLTWLHDVLREHNLLQGLCRRVTNFSSDLKDGAAYILLLYCLNPRNMALEHLEHNDFFRRMDAVMQATRAIGLDVGVTTEELVSGQPDYHIVFMFALWSRYSVPEALTSFETSAMESIMMNDARTAFVDDVREFAKKLSVVRRMHQNWLVERNIAMRYVNFLMINRSRGHPIRIMNKQEAEDYLREERAFTVVPTSKLPEAFVQVAGRSRDDPEVAQILASNEAESAAVTAVLSRYYQHIRSIYRYYSTLGVTSPRPLALDVVQFHRLCLDSKILGAGFKKKECVAMFNETNQRNLDLTLLMAEEEGSGLATSMNDGTTSGMRNPNFELPLDGSNSRQRRKRRTKSTTSSPSRPTTASSATAAAAAATPQKDNLEVSLVGDINKPSPQSPRNSNSNNKPRSFNNPENMLLPTEFIQVLCRVAIRKFAENGPLTPFATSPLKLSDMLQQLLTKHILCKASIADTSEFKSDIFSDLVQGALRRNRRSLMKVFKQYSTSLLEYSSGITVEGLGQMLRDVNMMDDSAGNANVITPSGGRAVLTNRALLEIFAQFSEHDVQQQQQQQQQQSARMSIDGGVKPGSDSTRTPRIVGSNSEAGGGGGGGGGGG